MKMNTKKIAVVGMLCAMAMIVNVLIHFPMVPAVSWLNYDPKDVVIVIGGFIYGPITSLIMSAVCSVLELGIRGGTILDIVMNMISTCSFACTAAYIYKKNHTKKGALIGLLCGVVLMSVCMVLWNYIITPIYFGMPREAVIAMLLPGIVPFNLLKSGLNAAITLMLYKPVVGALRQSHLIENHEEHKTKGMILLGMFIAITIICIIAVI